MRIRASPTASPLPDSSAITGPAQHAAETVAADRKFITALARGLEVLRAFTPVDGLLSNQELVRRTGLPKATVSRLTYTLTKLGYLDYSESRGRFQLAPAVLSLGYAALPQIRIREAAKPLMRAFSKATDMTVGLCLAARGEVLIVESCRGAEGAGPNVPVGTRLPMTTTAAGMALLAAMTEVERRCHLGGEGHAAGRSDSARTAPSLAEVEKHGFISAIGDWQPDVATIAAPIPTSAKFETSVLAVFALVGCLPPERVRNEIGPQLVTVVRQLCGEHS